MTFLDCFRRRTCRKHDASSPEVRPGKPWYEFWWGESEQGRGPRLKAVGAGGEERRKVGASAQTKPATREPIYRAVHLVSTKRTGYRLVSLLKDPWREYPSSLESSWSISFPIQHSSACEMAAVAIFGTHGAKTSGGLSQSNVFSHCSSMVRWEVGIAVGIS